MVGAGVPRRIVCRTRDLVCEDGRFLPIVRTKHPLCVWNKALRETPFGHVDGCVSVSRQDTTWYRLQPVSVVESPLLFQRCLHTPFRRSTDSAS